MKRTAAVWSVVLLLAGPVWGGDPQPQDHQPDHEQLVNRLFSSWSDHNLDDIDLLFAADGVYEDVPPQKTYRGPEEIKGFLSAIWGWAFDIRFDVTSIAVAGDTVVAEWTMSGTQTGPIGAIPASGNDFSVRGASVVEIKDGKIKRISDYYDLSSLLVQFGVRYAAPPPKTKD